MKIKLKIAKTPKNLSILLLSTEQLWKPMHDEVNSMLSETKSLHQTLEIP